MAELNDKDAEQKIAGLFHIVSMIAFAAVPMLLLLRDVFIPLFAVSSYSFSGRRLPFFFFGWVFDLFFYFSLLGIYRSQKTILQLVLFATAILIVTSANILLIPKFDLYGAAISFCITKIAVFTILQVWFRRYFHLRVNLTAFILVPVVARACSYGVCVLPLAISSLIAVCLFCSICIYLFKHKKNSPL